MTPVRKTRTDLSDGALLIWWPIVLGIDLAASVVRLMRRARLQARAGPVLTSSLQKR